MIVTFNKIKLGLFQAKPSQAKPSQAKPSQAKPSQAKPSQAKPSQAKPSQNKYNFNNIFNPISIGRVSLLQFFHGEDNIKWIKKS
ncbi:hypothetical protein [Brachyspira hyodysenteriae]|uniref:hypothetical protein n=1 Tax=Brachyspira hyodysenteriae TaxID=159 RepID=UPI0022CE3135|nr:hypothetical protein [Brachyspira hyodysenteriae]MCZ9888096.1 hypothetical protein [Brachyspira hyodysenteriae]